MFAKNLLSDIPEKLQQVGQSFVSGVRKADAVQRRQVKETGSNYGQSILDPRFRTKLQGQGVSFKNNPAEFLGAYASRGLVDIAADGTRTYFWRYNHPLAISSGLSELYLGNYTRSATGKAAITAGIGIPAIAAAGTYDITNPGEMFRPKGYAQRYSEEGTDDRRQTTQPGAELFERFFLGRTGDPLKYETAKQDIPDLTPERWGNYQQFLYQDKGLLGLGVLKGTMENLEGNPEVRLLGFPANIPMAGGFVGGTLAAKAALSQKTPVNTPNRPARRLAGGFAAAVGGSIGGVLLGNAVNEVIAMGNRPTYPSTNTYDQNIS